MYARTRVFILIVLVALTATVQANTRFGFGTIIDADPTGERSRRNIPSFTIRYEWYNLSPSTIFKHITYRMDERTRHGHRVYFLDGKPSTWQEAIKVGRAVCVSDNEQVCWVSSQPGPQAELPQPSAQNCWLQVSLRKALATTAGKVNRGKVGDMKPITRNVVLLVDIRDGAITGAVASIPDLKGADYILDHGTLSYADGKLTGAIAIDAPFTEGTTNYRLASGDEVHVTCRFEVMVGDDNELTGSYTGTSGDEAREDSVSGKRHGRKDRGEHSRVCLQFWYMEEDILRYAILPVNGTSAQPGGDFLFSKGHTIGTVPVADLSITDTRISGDLTIDSKQDHQVAIDAVIIGDRLLFGTWTEAGVTRPLRGAFTPGIDSGPQLHSSTEEQLKIRADMRRELYPDDPKYQEKK